MKTNQPKKLKEIKCSICKKPIEPKGTWIWGNNAEPINDGRCCDFCDDMIVIPERIRIYLENKK
jgi:hypothetical protein